MTSETVSKVAEVPRMPLAGHNAATERPYGHVPGGTNGADGADGADGARHDGASAPSAPAHAEPARRPEPGRRPEPAHPRSAPPESDSRARPGSEWPSREWPGSEWPGHDTSAAVTLYEIAAAYGRGEVADVSAKSGLDEARVEAGWRTLGDMGLVRVVDGRVETVDPDTALASVMGRYTANVHDQLQAALAVNDATQKLLTVFRPAAAQRQEQVAVEQFKGIEARDSALRDITEALRETLDTAYQGPPDPEALAKAVEPNAALARRGVRVRALYPRNLLGVPAYARYLAELSDVGVTVRVIDHVAHDMLVFDRHTVCLPGGLGDMSESVIRIRGALLVESFASIYESYWQRATPLSLASTRPHHTELTRQERAVIRLMTNGYSDDRIATKLAIDKSAVQEVMTTLMERLGAGSRFEVGYKLACDLDPRDL
ncbi:LuxR C-terminal-related transcriptional regulator [Streptomyces sp.]|uniref:LuxR C-terminal-related transcriptional regulator n=1 Tax=Streptomyces sp. TaxID=1931 RepID=UPI002F3EC167